MSYSTLLENLGFESDPFATTNADEEVKLSKYFVPPPFFSAVLGDYQRPKSSIVFAPRGGGKTALKRKIEIDSETGKYICVAYNNFDTTGLDLEAIDAGYHLKNIVELVLTSIIISVNTDRVTELNNSDRHILYSLVKQYFSKIDRERFKSDIASVKNIKDSASDVWNKFTGPIGVGLNLILARLGITSVEVAKYESSGGEIGSYKEQLGILSDISLKFGFKSIYVLIDKVDENPLIGNSSEKSYNFIKSILLDLSLLEMPGYAFKFFLWSLTQPSFTQEGRPDRVKGYVLDWSHEHIEAMLSERLKAFSGGKIHSLSVLLKEDYPISLDKMVAIAAQGSPRNMVRICKAIFDAQSTIATDIKHISSAAIDSGFSTIAAEISEEIFAANTIRDLKRTARSDFTITHLSSEVFKITQPAVNAKIQSWEASGAVAKVGMTNTTAKSRPSNLYAIQNILLAKHVFASSSAKDFVMNKIRICDCGHPLLRDWDRRSSYLCEKCQTECAC